MYCGTSQYRRCFFVVFCLFLFFNVFLGVGVLFVGFFVVGFLVVGLVTWAIHL